MKNFIKYLYIFINGAILSLLLVLSFRYILPESKISFIIAITVIVGIHVFLVNLINKTVDK